MLERDDVWLSSRLDLLWEKHFSDVQRLNPVRICFKGKWKNKFGHIRLLKNKETEIVVNGMFKSFDIPDFILELTIAHELVHYSHGFQSPHPQLYTHPHQGSVVNQDLKKRGFHEHLRQERKWIKEVWRPHVQKVFAQRKRVLKRRFWF